MTDVPVAAVLIAVGSLLLAVAAGLALGPAAGLAVAGGLALWFGIDASKDVLPQQSRGTESGGHLRAVGDS
jgi:hypothetical protein